MKQPLAYYLSMAISGILFPLLLPTYAIILYSLQLPEQYPAVYKGVAIGGTAFFTLFIPFTLLLILKAQKRISDINITNPKERLVPFLYVLTCFAIWVYFLWHVLKMPAIITALALTSTIMIALLTLITHYWKMSAHLTAFGCFVGSIIAVAAHMGIYNTYTIIALLIIALLLMMARLYLKAHDSLQVVTGFLFALSVTLLVGMFI